MKYDGTSTDLEVEAGSSILQSKFVFLFMQGRKQRLEILHASTRDCFSTPGFTRRWPNVLPRLCSRGSYSYPCMAGSR